MKGTTGTPTPGITKSRALLKREAAARRREERLNAARSGPVTVTRLAGQMELPFGEPDIDGGTA